MGAPSVSPWGPPWGPPLRAPSRTPLEASWGAPLGAPWGPPSFWCLIASKSATLNIRATSWGVSAAPQPKAASAGIQWHRGGPPDLQQKDLSRDLCLGAPCVSCCSRFSEEMGDPGGPSDASQGLQVSSSDSQGAPLGAPLGARGPGVPGGPSRKRGPQEGLRCSFSSKRDERLLQRGAPSPNFTACSIS